MLNPLSQHPLAWFQFSQISVSRLRILRLPCGTYAARTRGVLRCVSLLFALSAINLHAQQRTEDVVRTWTDAAGRFTVEAQLLKQTESAVQLRKSDGRTVTVPVNKLSKADQEYLAQRAKYENPFESGEMEEANSDEAATPTTTPKPAAGSKIGDADYKPGTLALPDHGQVILLSEGTPCQPLDADPAANIPKLDPGQVYLADTDAYDKVSELVSLDTNSNLVAISVGRNLINRPDETYGKIFTGQLPKGPFKEVFNASESIRIFDHDPTSGRTLSVGGLDHSERGGELVVLAGVADDRPRELYRRSLPGAGKPGFQPQVTYARWIAPDTALVIVDHKLYCWNLDQAVLIYRSEDHVIRSPTPPRLSPGRRYLAIPTNKGFNLIGTSSGDDLGFVGTGNSLAPGISFHPDGHRIAYSWSNAWGVWDLTQARKINGGVSAEHLGDRLAGWIDSNWFMNELGNVIDTESQMLVWMYYASPIESRRIWNGSMSVVSKSQGLKILTLPIPEQRSLDAVKYLDRQQNLMITTPGTQVRIAVEAPQNVDIEELAEALEVSIKRAGWEVNTNAKLTVAAKIGRGQPYDLEYHNRPFRSPSFGGESHKVQIHPFTASLEIREGNRVLWQRDTENRVPPMLFLKSGQTVQDAVKEFERPQPEFFSNLHIPPRIPREEFAKGLGASRMHKGTWVDFQRR